MLPTGGGGNLEDANMLVVEDEALIRMATMCIAEDAGYRVVEAADADEALIMLERCQGIDTVLTDINMPGSMDGLQFSHLVRERWPQIGLVITSGRCVAHQDQMPTGTQFVAKPYTPEAIVAALRNSAR
jgi:CheY-like chemotaxis protein